MPFGRLVVEVLSCLPCRGEPVCSPFDGVDMNIPPAPPSKGGIRGTRRTIDN